MTSDRRRKVEEIVRTVAHWDVDEASSTRVHSVNVRGFATLPTTVTAR